MLDFSIKYFKINFENFEILKVKLRFTRRLKPICYICLMNTLKENIL